MLLTRSYVEEPAYTQECIQKAYLTLFDADVLLRLESHVTELEVFGVESKLCQLLDFLESEWEVSGRLH